MKPGAVIRSSTRAPGVNVRFFMFWILDSFTFLKSVIVPLRRFFELIFLNGHFFLGVQVTRALPPLGTFGTLSLIRNVRVLVTPQLIFTFDLIRFFFGGGAAATRMGCAWVVALPAPSVAVTVTLNAPAVPNACETAPPV